MRRVLINGLTLLSGLLAVGTMALWGASYYYRWAASRSDHHVVGATENFRMWTIGWDSGGVGLYDFQVLDPARDPDGLVAQLGRDHRGWEGQRQPRIRYPSVDDFKQFKRQWHGFGYGREEDGLVTQEFGVQGHDAEWIAPAWSVPVPFCLLPLYRLWRWRKRAVPAGHCRKCGYDLRASPNQCPECGMVVGGVAA